MSDKVLTIVGPTASGKSDLAVRLAQALNGEIISADSRQIYKGLDVGTGKITQDEMRGIPHHLLDVANPRNRFTAHDYQKLAEKALQYIVTKSRLPIVVGGSGFYISAIAEIGKLPEVPPNTELRAKLELMGNTELVQLLEEKDPVRASEIDPHNKRRLVRALEVVEALGKVPTRRPGRSTSGGTPYEFVYIGLNPEMKVLEEKIRLRLKKRMQGMLTEARSLHAEGLTYKRMRELGLEYKFLAMYLEGELELEEMQEKLCKAIRQYAKRQMTWFKRNEKIKWFEPSGYEEIEKYLKSKI